MNDQKMQQLLAAARAATPPAPPADFASTVHRALRPAPAPKDYDLGEQLTHLFPRLAWGAVAFMALCLICDLAVNKQVPDLGDSLSQISQQWLLPGSGL